MIDFTLTPEQQQIREGSAAFASSVLASASKTYSHLSTQKERFQSTRSLYRTAVQCGQIKAQIPVPLGGLNASLVDAAIALEEMYAVDPSVTLTIAATGLGLTPLVLGGNPEQHERFLKPFLSGDGEPLASLVHSEPGGTANWLEKGSKGLQTTAKKEGGFWVINGEKVSFSHSKKLLLIIINCKLALDDQ
jgi:alkylation response protein AidB-like acyl-CoA dehydrogenase